MLQFILFVHGDLCKLRHPVFQRLGAATVVQRLHVEDGAAAQGLVVGAVANHKFVFINQHRRLFKMQLNNHLWGCIIFKGNELVHAGVGGKSAGVEQNLRPGFRLRQRLKIFYQRIGHDGFVQLAVDQQLPPLKVVIFKS